MFGETGVESGDLIVVLARGDSVEEEAAFDNRYGYGKVLLDDEDNEERCAEMGGTRESRTTVDEVLGDEDEVQGRLGKTLDLLLLSLWWLSFRVEK